MTRVTSNDKSLNSTHVAYVNSEHVSDISSAHVSGLNISDVPEVAKIIGFVMNPLAMGPFGPIIGQT